MSLLDHPEAQAILADAVVTPDAVEGQADRLTSFLRRYLPRFYRLEQRATAALVIRGRLGGLERKTFEPIAIEAGLPRKPIRFFVGSGKWDDEAVMGELRRHIREELADPDGVVIVDPSGFPKKGAESCGVDRQWCGRLGKVDNCQVGVFLAYATEAGYAPLAAGSTCPRSGPTTRPVARSATSPRGSSSGRPGGSPWTCSTGACPDCPTAGSSATTSWAGPPSSAPRCVGMENAMPWTCRATPRCATWSGVARPARRPASAADARSRSSGPTPAGRQPESRRERITVRDGEKGPLVVDAMGVRVRTKQEGRVGPEERPVVIRPVGESRVDYALSDADPGPPLAEVVRAQRQRHRIEEVFGAGKGEVGLDHYEVRSWVGWHHHMTLCLVALRFLCLGRRRVGGGSPRDHGAACEADPVPIAPRPASEPGGDRQRGVAGAAA